MIILNDRSFGLATNRTQSVPNPLPIAITSETDTYHKPIDCLVRDRHVGMERGAMRP
jgi:hypothetical protein